MVNVNMRSILVLNSKGGSGKTTIATNLASFFASIGKSVALVDLDAQQSSISWLKARSSAKPPIIGIKGYGEKVKRGVDYKIIDAPAGLQGAAGARQHENRHEPVIPAGFDRQVLGHARPLWWGGMLQDEPSGE